MSSINFEGNLPSTITSNDQSLTISILNPFFTYEVPNLNTIDMLNVVKPQIIVLYAN